MSQVKREPVHAGEFLLSEGTGCISRESIVLLAGVALPAGQLLGRVSSGGLYGPYDPAADTGLETAVGILYGPVAESESERRGTAVVRLAEVSETVLTGLDAAARAALLEHYLIVR